MRSLITALILLAACIAQAQDWAQVELGTSEDILAIEETSFSPRWVVGTSGFAAQSDHLREVWTPVSVGTATTLNSIIQPAFGQVWLGAGAGVVRRLIGTDWEGRNLPSGQDFSLFTRGSGTAGAVGRAGDIYTTVNGGDDWAHKGNAGVPLNAAKGFVTWQFWVVGDGGTILKTTDGGDNYDLLPSGTSADLYDFLEGGYGRYWAVGAQGTILMSADGGASWEPKNSGTYQTLRSIASSGQNGAWLLIVGDNGTVLKSTDIGENWCRLFPETTADLHACAMVTNSEYIVGGEDGVMLRSTNGGGDCISVAADFLPSAGLELSLWPNPLRDAGRVELAAERAGAYELTIFDPAGRRVASLARGQLGPGERRQHALDTRGWSAGVYFLRLDQGERQISRRFTLLR